MADWEYLDSNNAPTGEICPICKEQKTIFTGGWCGTIPPAPICGCTRMVSNIDLGELTTSEESTAQEVAEVRPDRYHKDIDVMDLQGYVMKNYAARLICDAKEFAIRVWCVGCAIKHLLRLGLKDDISIELLKAEDYIHRARTGEFLPKE